MRIAHGLDGLRQLSPGAAISIGNFDGIHRGHRSLLGLAERLRPSSPGGLAVVSFEPHPLTVLKPEAVPPRLTPLDVKESILTQLGVDTLVLLAPTEEFLGLSAERFWEILRDEVCPAHLIEGESFTFGKARGGTIQKLQQWANGTAVRVHVAPPIQAVLLDLAIVTVSSSLVRWLIARGRVRDAAICLGRPYQLRGEVIAGHQRGRTIGTPTANLLIADQLLPADGVYAGRAAVNGTAHAVALSIGTLPTFDGHVRQVEAHLLDFAGDLYGTILRVDCVDFLREQQKYPNIDALKSQIARDLQAVRDRTILDPARQIACLDSASAV